MNFRFFDDLVGSAPGASQEFRFRDGKHSAKNYSEDYWKFLENLHKILKISKIFLVKFKKKLSKNLKIFY